jgi:hypothetical protein
VLPDPRCPDERDRDAIGARVYAKYAAAFEGDVDSSRVER